MININFPPTSDTHATEITNAKMIFLFLINEIDDMVEFHIVIKQITSPNHNTYVQHSYLFFSDLLFVLL